MALKKSQRSLKKWTKQKWRTKSGKPSIQGPDATGERYKPAAEHAKDSPQKTGAETRAKRTAIAKGEQRADYGAGNPNEDAFLAKHMRMEYSKKPKMSAADRKKALAIGYSKYEKGKK